MMSHRTMFVLLAVATAAAVVTVGFLMAEIISSVELPNFDYVDPTEQWSEDVNIHPHG